MDEVLDHLLRTLKNGKTLDARRNAATSLCKFREPEAVAGLIEGLNDHEDVAIFCVLALAQIGSESLPALRKALKSDHDAIRGYAAEILGELCDPEALEDLFLLIKNDSSNWVKTHAIGALVRIRNARSVEFLENLLEHPENWVVVNSSLALHRIGYKNKNLSAILLQKLIEDNSPGRNLIAWGLVEIGDKNHARHLEGYLHKTGDHELKKTLENIVREIRSR